MRAIRAYVTASKLAWLFEEDRNGGREHPLAQELDLDVALIASKVSASPKAHHRLALHACMQTMLLRASGM